jgi:diguanylate cyclase (GGDEF)-like protein
MGIGFLKARENVPDGQPDRVILRTSIAVATLALLMLVSQLVDLIDGSSDYRGVWFWVETAAGVVMLVIVAIAAPRMSRQSAQRQLIANNALEARNQVEQLFQMTDILQSALDQADANAVLRATAARLLKGLGGALYVFNNSRDRLDLSTTWDWPNDELPLEAFSPSQCWALKRGKPHLNGTGSGALRCDHCGGQAHVLEIPMMARAEVYGLLMFEASGDNAEKLLADIRPVANAVADAISLALANLSLREKLRTQALRDALTGLYNRRYMEDVLERYVNLASRNGNSVSAIMIDLDHFKRLNDEYGHAVGDAVLRETASAIVGALRPSDIACRYGGEELVVLLPDASLEDAVAKAETLRARVETLTEVHGTRVTASFGVAAIPETSNDAVDVLTMADAALYRAKQGGRNQVVAAHLRQDRSALRRAAE